MQIYGINTFLTTDLRISAQILVVKCAEKWGLNISPCFVLLIKQKGKNGTQTEIYIYIEFSSYRRYQIVCSAAIRLRLFAAVALRMQGEREEVVKRRQL